MSSGLSLWRSFSPLTRLSAQITSFTFTSLVFSRSFSSTTLRCDDEQLQQQKPKDEGWFSTAKLPDMPSLPDLPSLPTFELPSLPNMPELPSFDGFEDLRKSMTEFKDKVRSFSACTLVSLNLANSSTMSFERCPATRVRSIGRSWIRRVFYVSM